MRRRRVGETKAAVARMIAEGLGAPEMAARLRVSRSIVYRHARAVLGSHRRLNLVRLRKVQEAA